MLALTDLSLKQVRFQYLWSMIVTILSYVMKVFAANQASDLANIGSSCEEKSIGTLPQSNNHQISSQPKIVAINNSNSSNPENKSKPQQQSSSNSFLVRFLYAQYTLFNTGAYSNRIKLVLDLDETLISSSTKHSLKHDISVSVYIGGMPSTFFVRKRPHVDYFLDTVSQWFELVVFTASISPYANAVIDKLDPKRHITRRYYRQSCINKGGNYVKDLKVVCRDLSKVMIIDNSPIAYSINKENAIPIDDWFGNNNQDKSLLNLIPLLENIKNQSEFDVRHSLQMLPKGANRRQSMIGS